mmetsp:Transcript_30448/g.81049  ORF Transcript_30448/g.81049 Transcript_30448/m.81049 type:complete len:527 (-) Transcript_30448:178-1758(-)
MAMSLPGGSGNAKIWELREALEARTEELERLRVAAAVNTARSDASIIPKESAIVAEAARLRQRLALEEERCSRLAESLRGAESTISGLRDELASSRRSLEGSSALHAAEISELKRQVDSMRTSRVHSEAAARKRRVALETAERSRSAAAESEGGRLRVLLLELGDAISAAVQGALKMEQDATAAANERATPSGPKVPATAANSVNVCNVENHRGDQSESVTENRPHLESIVLSTGFESSNSKQSSGVVDIPLQHSRNQVEDLSFSRHSSAGPNEHRMNYDVNENQEGSGTVPIARDAGSLSGNTSVAANSQRRQVAGQLSRQRVPDITESTMQRNSSSLELKVLTSASSSVSMNGSLVDVGESAWEEDEAGKLHLLLNSAPLGSPRAFPAGGHAAQISSDETSRQLASALAAVEQERQERESERGAYREHLETVSARLAEVERERELLFRQLEVLKEQLAQLAAGRDRSGSAEHAEYAKNLVVTFLETRDPSLLPALRQVFRLTSNEVARVERGQKTGRGLLGFLS